MPKSEKLERHRREAEERRVARKASERLIAFRFSGLREVACQQVKLGYKPVLMPKTAEEIEVATWTIPAHVPDADRDRYFGDIPARQKNMRRSWEILSEPKG